MNYTENYQLNQWDASDYVRREDFNEDNRKIEEAIKALDNKRLRVVPGSYTGDGSTSQFISLGQQPQMLIVTYNGRTSQGNIMYGGIVYPDMPSECIVLNETGFTAYGGTANNSYRANLVNSVYRYIALYWRE